MVPSAIVCLAPAESIQAELNSLGFYHLEVRERQDCVDVTGAVASFTSKRVLIEWAKGRQSPTNVNAVNVN